MNDTPEPVNMAQTMSILAMSLVATTTIFYKPEDTEEHKVMITYLCFAVFFNQLADSAKHKDKMIGILEAVISELKEPGDGEYS